MTGKFPDISWITDRLPTAEDADPEGFVVYTQENWQNLVIPRTPWLPYSPPQPAGVRRTLLRVTMPHNWDNRSLFQ